MKDLEGVEERYALNSRVVKGDGGIVEEVYRVGGTYGRCIEAIIEHLEAAIAYASEPMANALRALIAFYRSGEDADREAYDIAWVQDRESPVDTINGFVEVYLDARSIKGAWEALVFYGNAEKTHQIRTLAEHAQWFEDHMPWDPKYRKEGVHGVTARAIDVVIETGESGPITPVGINLPNDQGIRERYGSKSVSLSNVNEAFDRSTLPEFRTEFSSTPEEASRATKWSALASELTTNMHEVIGHGSGKVDQRLNGSPQAALREHFSAIEESRADLVALYFVADRRLVELGLVEPESHDEIVRAEYEAYARNALVQLRRVRQGTHIEEDHMRNRQMIVRWLMRHTRAVDVRGRTAVGRADTSRAADTLVVPYSPLRCVRPPHPRRPASPSFKPKIAARPRRTTSVRFDPARTARIRRRGASPSGRSAASSARRSSPTSSPGSGTSCRKSVPSRRTPSLRRRETPIAAR